MPNLQPSVIHIQRKLTEFVKPSTFHSIEFHHQTFNRFLNGRRSERCGNRAWSPIKVERLIRPGEGSQELPEESDFGLAMNSEVIEHLMEEDQNPFSISSLHSNLSQEGRVDRRLF